MCSYADYADLTSAFSDRTFGVELECILRHSVPAASKKKLHTVAAQHIQKHTAIDIIHPGSPHYEHYRAGIKKRKDWMIVNDPTVYLNPNEFRYSRERQLYPNMGLPTWFQLWKGAEIVSPILTERSWGEVEDILEAIQTPPMAVIHNKSTSTHIHIGIQTHSGAPLGAEEGLNDLKKVAAVFYIFETYLNLLCPDHRVNDWCHRTRRNMFAKRCTEREFCETLSNIESLRDLHYFMNCTGLSRNDDPMASRYFGGNFANCMNVWEKWTIEFRSHEGTKNNNDLLSWGKLLMRLFDQAVDANWDFIMYLCDSAEHLNSEGICGSMHDRDLKAWRVWVLSMHSLFIMFLVGRNLCGKHMDMVNPQALEQYILSQPPEMTDEELVNDIVRSVREEEMLLQNFIIYMTMREAKFSPQYEKFMGGNFEDWSSANSRMELPGDWIDYPNPSGIVRDRFGRDIPIDIDFSEDCSHYPAA
ncbi:putative amidoligase enzyme-domain-containing protein [Terfezia claveryi]|nr:putative amidoligase enzyme-domain-containing protein [Terfezia claveryi]